MPKVNPLNLLVGIIINPVSTFKQLRDAKHGYWWVVLLLTAVLGGALGLAATNAQMQSIQGQFGGPGQGGFVAGQQGGAVPGGAQVTAFQGPSPVLVLGGAAVGVAVGAILDYLLRALIVFLMSMVIGGKAAFKDTFRMAAWTTIPGAIRALVQAIAVAVTGGQVAAGLSAAMTSAEVAAAPLVGMLLGHLDLYMVWSMLLLGIGAAITGKMSRGKAIATVLVYMGVSLVFILVGFAITSAITGALAPAGGAGPRGGGGLRRFGG